MAKSRKTVSIDTLVFSREPLTPNEGKFILSLLELCRTAIQEPKEFYRVLDRTIPLREETVQFSARIQGTDPKRERREIQAAVLWTWGQTLKQAVAESERIRQEMYSKPAGVDQAARLATEEAQRRLEAKKKGQREKLDEMVRSRLVAPVADEVLGGLFSIENAKPGTGDMDPYLYQKKELNTECPEQDEYMEMAAEVGPIGAREEFDNGRE